MNIKRNTKVFQIIKELEENPVILDFKYINHYLTADNHLKFIFKCQHCGAVKELSIFTIINKKRNNSFYCGNGHNKKCKINKRNIPKININEKIPCFFNIECETIKQAINKIIKKRFNIDKISNIKLDLISNQKIINDYFNIYETKIKISKSIECLFHINVLSNRIERILIEVIINNFSYTTVIEEV